jgi:Na+-transporting NADH:ubiquinone oxidoreductase subunit NqrF
VYPEGKMSQHFASLKPGDVVEVKGYVILIHDTNSRMLTLSIIKALFLSGPLKSSDILLI